MTLVIRRTSLVTACGVCAIILAGCGGSDEATGPIRRVPQSLVGTWTGTIKADQATDPIDMTLFLRADSTMLANVPYVNPNCAPAGTWTATVTQMTATGYDCQGVVVTWVGLISVGRVRGTFSTSTGVRGTFDVEKKAQ
jgi:hypothetical protein